MKGLTIDELKKLAFNPKIQVDAIVNPDNLFKFPDARYIIYLMLPQSDHSGHYVAMVNDKTISLNFDSFGVGPSEEIMNLLGRPLL